MSDNKQRRIGTAAGFLSGVIACMDAVRDSAVSWPPMALWEALRRPKRLELVGGIALIIVTLVTQVLLRQKNH